MILNSSVYAFFYCALLCYAISLLAKEFVFLIKWTTELHACYSITLYSRLASINQTICLYIMCVCGWIYMAVHILLNIIYYCV